MLSLYPPLHITLPKPLPLSQCFVNLDPRRAGARAGRVKSKAYTAWIKHADEMIRCQRTRSFDVPVEVTVFIGEINVGSMDADNAGKCLFDTLTRNKIIVDDSRKWMRAEQKIWVPGMAGTVVRIMQADDAPRAPEIVSLVPYGMRETLR